MTVATDETRPLLASNHSADAAPTNANANANANVVIVVDFHPDGSDADNPLNWPTPFKWGIVMILALMAFTVTMTCIAVVPLASSIGRDLSHGERTKSASVLLVTIWELGEAAGPLLIAPLSELYGRYPVMNGANCLLILSTVLCATATSVPAFVAARMLSGVAVAGNVLNPAIVGDMFAPDERGSALSAIFLAPLIGGAFGPAISASVAERWGWRVAIWGCVLVAVACEVLLLTCFRETYKVAILRRRARGLQSGGGGAKDGVVYRTEFDGDGGKGDTPWTRLRDSVFRPFIVLFGSGVLMGLCVLGSVLFSFFYVTSTTLSDILLERYHLSPVATGLCFVSFSVGSFFSVVFCNYSLDKVYMTMRDTHKGVGQPEFRLPLAVTGALGIPFCVTAYGWISELVLPLPLLLLSLALVGSTLMLAMIPVMAYVVDAFGVYSASALTGIIVTRCLMGTFLPLTSGLLIDNFGYGWGFSVYGVGSLCLAPIPMLILRYGKKWRQASAYTREQ
ncbi:major facilitator superfamily domain-containing protein [Podospora appendiculata]|uniref:Major facilitator superfamily domain-containing protein n=1 Tax=Podospora appendiculata TaxID=314037 RepID=A0AAE0WZ21_9PEZI|nr:major facilitator superfamily domain-containing protein [Podospora appendiculata]